MARGGKRKGAGRPVGSKNEDTLLRERAEAEYRNRVVELTDKLMDRQLELAQGCSYLYCIETDSKGKRKAPRLVTDEEEIRTYLEDSTDDRDYYYITTERPDLRAIQDMMDRTYGKAKSNVDMNVKGDLSFNVLNYGNSDSKTDN